MTSITRRGAVAASGDEVWTALADFGAISAWAPNVDHSWLITDGDVGPGSVRRVQAGPMALLEQIVAWEPAARIGYRLDGLPGALGTVTNTWEIDSHGEHTHLALTTNVDAGARPPKKVVAKLACQVLARASDQMLGGLTTYVESNVDRTTT